MKFRKLAGISVLLLAVISLAACSNDTGGTSAGGKQTVSWAVINGSEAAKTIIPAFEKKNPGIHVDVSTLPTDTYQTLMRTKLSAGNAPDVIGVFPGDGSAMAMKTLQRAGLLKDLSGQPIVKNIPPGFKGISSVNGKTYITVIEAAGIGAIYNMDAMKAAGLTPPATWSEVLKFCSDAQSAGKSAFSLAVATEWNTQLIPYALTPTLVYGPNPDFAAQMTDQKVTFANSKWKDAFEKYFDMQKAGCFQKGDLGTVYDDALSMVGKGTSFANVAVQSSIRAMEKVAPKGTVMKLYPLPATDDPSETRMPLAGGASFGVNAKAKNVDAALKLVNFLGSVEGQALWAKASGSLPAMPSESFNIPDSLEIMSKYTSEGKTDPFPDQLWPNPKVQQVHISGLQTMLGGTLSPEDLLKRMDSAYGEGQ